METNQSAVAPLEHFRRLSTCVVASAVEGFRVRLPNTGFADSTIRCIFDDRPPIAGYAATARIRTATPPMEGPYQYARSDWWDYILTIPSPRIVVIEDLDDPPGLGGFIGEVHAHILMALGCEGLVTNGGVRDLDEILPAGFAMFARNVSVSHAYAHIVDFGGPVVIGGLEVRPGDLIHADRHGVQSVPLAIAERVPAAAEQILQRRKRIVGLCRSSTFSVENLRQAVAEPDRES